MISYEIPDVVVAEQKVSLSSAVVVVVVAKSLQTTQRKLKNEVLGFRQLKTKLQINYSQFLAQLLHLLMLILFEEEA